MKTTLLKFVIGIALVISAIIYIARLPRTWESVYNDGFFITTTITKCAPKGLLSETCFTTYTVKRVE